MLQHCPVEKVTIILPPVSVIGSEKVMKMVMVCPATKLPEEGSAVMETISGRPTRCPPGTRRDSTRSDSPLTASVSVLDVAAKYKRDLLFNRWQAANSYATRTLQEIVGLLALMLLIASGLLFRTFQQLRAIDHRALAGHPENAVYGTLRNGNPMILLTLLVVAGYRWPWMNNKQRNPVPGR